MNIYNEFDKNLILIYLEGVKHMWVKAHFIDGGDVIYINTQNIVAVYAYQGDGQYKGQTVIQFSGDEDNYIRVKETVDEIGEHVYGL